MLLKNCKYMDNGKIRKGDIRIGVENGIIEDVGDLKPEADEEDLEGRVVIPGMICYHAHAYSALAFAFNLREKPRDFESILKNLWWPLDSMLDREAVYCSGVLTAIEYLRHGVTTIFDHHASKNFIRGSLNELKKGFERIGIRGSLCYEITDRYGERKAGEAMDENERFIKQNGGLIGLHASFTLSDETLARCAELAEELDAGFHAHLAEGKIDNKDAVDRGYKSAADRLNTFGMLNSKSIIAHCVNVSKRDIKLLKSTNVATCPGSNANNGVGIMDLKTMLSEGVNVVLGNDSFGYDMLEEAKRLSFLQDLRRPLEDRIIKTIAFNSDLASNLLNRRVGKIEKGYSADLVVLRDWFNMESLNIEHVMVDGKWVIKNREFVNDPAEDIKRIRRAAERIGEKSMR
ncbi:MAG: amidohydrolase family protein [Candidatus Thermoplasmatota archaeon]|nr:amidohydrolase family protein [Candidatus Thermoplasmatota archaeon]